MTEECGRPDSSLLLRRQPGRSRNLKGKAGVDHCGARRDAPDRRSLASSCTVDKRLSLRTQDTSQADPCPPAALAGDFSLLPAVPHCSPAAWDMPMQVG